MNERTPIQMIYGIPHDKYSCRLDWENSKNTGFNVLKTKQIKDKLQ